MEFGTPTKSPQGSPAVTAYETVWDQRPKKYKNVIFQVCFFILLMELAERLSYYGINQGLRNFMVKIGWSAVSASALKSTWTSICYCSPLFGAWLADEKWGRFRTILTFGIWYCIGDFLVAIAAHPDIMDKKGLVNPIFVIGLYVGIGIGTGAIKSNVITLGADQFDPNDPREVAQKETFFSYFYFCINAGSIVSYGYLSTLSVQGGGFISAEYGYFATYLICAIVMCMALVMLVVGKSRYIMMKPTDRSFSTFVRLLWDSRLRNLKGKVLVSGTILFFCALWVNVIAAFTSNSENTSEVFSYIAGVCVLCGIISWVYCGMDQSFLDDCKIGNGGAFDDVQVDGYKKLVKCLPFAAFTIIWNCAYDQTDANFQSITQQCDLRWHRDRDDSGQIAGAALGVFDPIVIVIAIPVLETCIYPLWHKATGKAPSQFGKAVAGLIVACIGLFWAGIFETVRRNAGALVGSDGGPLLDDGSGEPMNDIYWTNAIPNYVFIALAECLINVTAYDVFYSTVPLTLKSTAMAVNLFMSSMGSVLTSVFTIMFSPYLKSDNLNLDNLEYMFYTVGAVSIVNLIAFVIVMRKMNFTMSSSVEESDDIDALVNKASTNSRASISQFK